MRKSGQKFGIVALAVALFTVCRPASATELVFNITAGQLESVFSDMSPIFGAGLCETDPSQVNDYCGAYQLAFTSTLPNAVITNVVSPIASGNGAWTATTVGNSTVEFYSNFTTSGNDPYVTLLTDNDYVAGNTFNLYEGISPGSVVSVTSTLPMTSSDVFSFDLSTSATNVTTTDAPFNISVVLVPLTYGLTPTSDDGEQNGSNKGELFRASDVVLTPEPSGVWLCLLGVAALFLGKKKFPASRIANREK